MSGERQILARATGGPPKSQPSGGWAAVLRIIDAFDRKIGSMLGRIQALEDRPVARDGRDGRDGLAGPQGDAGPPPTREQIAAAVAEYLAANPPAAGRDGRDGESIKGDPGEPGRDADERRMSELEARIAVLADDVNGLRVTSAEADDAFQRRVETALRVN